MFRISLALISATAVLAFAGCGHSDHSEDERPTVTVRTAVVSIIDTNEFVEAIGSLRSTQEAMIAGKVMGTITEIRKSAGETVRRGEILVRVDSRDVAGQISQAQGALAQASAAMALAETNFHRFEKLHAKGSASDLELDQARYQYETAKGAVGQAEGALATARSYNSYAEIAAPFDGRVVDRFAEVGDLAAPGHPLIKIEGEGSKRLHASLDAEKVGAVHVGDPVKVRISSLGRRLFEGRIAEVVPAADPGTHSFLIKIDLEEDPELRAGLFGTALIPIGQRKALIVPRTSVLERGGLTGIFVAQSGRASFRLVTVRETAGDSVEILSGLSSGDQIVLSPPSTLEVGSPIEVQG